MGKEKGGAGPSTPGMKGEEASGPRAFFPWISLLLVVMTGALYFQVLDHEFIDYDDQLYVTENRQVQAGLTLEGIGWAFTTFHTGNWHPVTWLSHMLDVELYGMNPRGHHFTSLLLHTANTVLLFLVLHRMTGALWRSAAVSALFAIHPLHVESVAWVAERKDALSGFFFFLTIWAYVGYSRRGGKLRYLGVIVFYAFGLMSKPMLVTLPFVLALLDYWPLDRITREEEKPKGEKRGISAVKPVAAGAPILWLVYEKIPLLILAAASSVVTVIAQQKGGAVSSLAQVPLGARVGNALVSYVSYIGKMLWPKNLAVFYPHPESSLPAWAVIGAGLLLVLISVALFRVKRRHPELLMGWLWYLGTLAPVIGIVQVGAQAMADRYTYIPLIGLFMIGVWSISDLLGKIRFRRMTIRIVVGGAASVLLVATSVQISYWRDSRALFEHAVRVTVDNSEAQTNLGVALGKQGDLDASVASFSTALKIKPNSHEAHANLGIALGKQGKAEEAILHLLEAVKIKPGFQKAHHDLGILLEAQGRRGEAITHYSKVVEINPDHETAHYSLGLALAREGRTEEAIAHFSEALRVTPRDALKRNNLGVAYFKLGRLDDAIREYQAALEINPRFSDALQNLDIARRLKNETKAAQPQGGNRDTPR